MFKVAREPRASDSSREEGRAGWRLFPLDNVYELASSMDRLGIWDFGLESGGLGGWKWECIGTGLSLVCGGVDGIGGAGGGAGGGAAGESGRPNAFRAACIAKDEANVSFDDVLLLWKELVFNRPGGLGGTVAGGGGGAAVGTGVTFGGEARGGFGGGAGGRLG